MAKRTFLAGATSQTCDVFIQDSSSTTGAGLSGLVFNTSNLACYYRKTATGTPTAITLATQTVGGAWSSGGFVELDATHAKGFYRFDIPDTVLATAPFATLHFYGATNMAQCPVELEIVAYNPFDGVRLGITALPNAAAEASGGLYTRGTGAGQIKQDANGRVDVNVRALLDTAWLTPGTAGTPDVNAKLHGGTAQTGRDIGLSVLLSSGTGTGQLDFTSGIVKADLWQILSTTLTETAGLLAGGFKKFFNKSSPTGTINSIPDAVAGATGGLFIAGTNAATTVTTSFTTTFTGNLSGSVGSVASGGIAAASFAAGAIDAAAIAADAIGSSELAATAANEIADAILARNLEGGSSTGRTVSEALYALRNKWTISGGTYTVYKTDDSTSSWTATLTGTAGADPVTASDPA